MKFSVYLRKLMAARNKHYSKIFFKSILFAVYFLFFTVQLFLRFASPNSQQFLGQPNFQSSSTSFTSTAVKNILSNPKSEKSGPTCYLNKHYHLKDAAGITAQVFHLVYSYGECLNKFYFGKERVADIKLNTAFLRGPPAVS